MKIGTISLNINTHDFNYGAMLHSWAFQQHLKKLDEVEYTEIINYTTPHLEKIDFQNPLLGLLRAKRFKSFLKTLFFYPRYKKRYFKFERFVKKHMIVSNVKYNQTTLNAAALNYDVLVCESDVIWSPGFFQGHFDKAFFLSLQSMKDMKKIAYAPSMGDVNLSSQEEFEFKNLLQNIDSISCRESYLVPIIEKATRIRAPHVLDPVLLLTADEYNCITADRIIADRYLLLYLPVDNNSLLRETACNYAKKNNLKIIDISTNLYKNDKNSIVAAGIEEFLSAIKYSEAVFTNSFHAICFSLIYQKQFYVFKRMYNGKIENICDAFSLSNRFILDGKIDHIAEIDYKEVNELLTTKRKFSADWLNKALKREI